jgi:hypothetical protein
MCEQCQRVQQRCEHRSEPLRKKNRTNKKKKKKKKKKQKSNDECCSVDERVLNLKAPEYKRGAELSALRATIESRANELRERKAATSGTTVAEKAAVFGIISDLLELKFLDEENDDCVPPKGFKLRWKVADKAATGGEKTLQRPVANRTSLSAAEVLFIVRTHTAKHFARAGGVVGDVLKIERVVRDAATRKHVCCAHRESDRIVLPLKFPGPVSRTVPLSSCASRLPSRRATLRSPRRLVRCPRCRRSSTPASISTPSRSPPTSAPTCAARSPPASSSRC